jgi:diguanylate cyclase (GGDEF)-like protein
MTTQVATVMRLVVLLTVALMLRLRHPFGAFEPVDVMLALGSVYVIVTTFLPRRIQRDGFVQVFLIVDVLLISGLIWYTGGARSEYYLLYYLPILHGASRLNFRDAITTSVLAAVTYVFIAVAAGPLVPVMTTGVLRAATFGGSVIVLAIFFSVLAQESRTNRLLTARLWEALESVSAVYDVARVASTRDSVNEVLETMLRQAVRLSEADVGALALLDADQRFQVVVRHGPEGTAGIEFDESLAREAIESRKWLARDASPASTDRPAKEFMVPLFTGWHPLGALQLRTALPTGLRKREMELVRTLCAEAAMAIENARLRGETRRAAATDYLTGLYNRREFERRLEAEIRRSARHGGEIVLLLLDVDDFKRCNDTYGHQAGDQVLQALAERLEGVIRSEDTAARYGGDEFAIILPQTDVSGGRVVAEKLQRELQLLRFDWSDERWRATVSLGIAASQAELSASLLLQKADRALYQAKASGKNQVRVWSRGTPVHKAWSV